MAQLFVEEGSEWLTAPLDGVTHTLWGDAGTTLRPRVVADGDGGSRPLIARAPELSGEETWLVIHAPGVALRINGTALTTGIRVLSHRDELRLTGVAGRVFFSLEGLARVAPFDGVDGSRCPRCQQPIERGTPAVRCPQCGVWHHESEEFGCWTYSPSCSLCDQPTELGAGFRWTPEEVSGHD
jgi:hypothetical protein